jgi:hypothetical protein
MRHGRIIQCIHTIPPGTGQLSNRTCRCQASESVRLADTLRPKSPAALLSREKNSMFYACVFAFWTLYLEEGFQ